MFVREIPYELVENLFGSWVADNFNKINLVLLIFGFLCWALFGNHSTKTTTKPKIQTQKHEEYIYYRNENGHLVQEKTGKVDTNTPSYLTPEEKELAKQIHISRTEPTFEEWKAAREQEQGKGKH